MHWILMKILLNPFRQAFQPLRELGWDHVLVPALAESQARVRWLGPQIRIRDEHLWKDGRWWNGSIQQLVLFVGKNQHGSGFLIGLLHAWEQMLSTGCRYQENLGVLLSGWLFLSPPLSSLQCHYGVWKLCKKSLIFKVIFTHSEWSFIVSVT